MDLVLNNLKTSVRDKNKKQIIQQLTELIKNRDNIKITDKSTFVELLKLEYNEVRVSATEAIAEACSASADNRKIFTDQEVVNILMTFLESGSQELVFNSIRALGNICYENQEGSDLISKIGTDSIIFVLKDDFKRDNNSITTKALGLLVNLLSTHDTIAKTALQSGILEVVEQLIDKYKASIDDNKLLLSFLLSIISSLTEYLDDKEYFFNKSLEQSIIDVFKQSEVPEISVMCLEILQPLCERDDVKILLAEQGVCELLYDLIQKHKHKVNEDEGPDGNARAVLKMACDLIVLVLTEDKCMDVLYANGEGRTYLNMLTWLDSNDADLLSTGILAIGNFARKDTNCIQMVRNGVAKRLIEILKKYNTSADLKDCKVQHALLSTLKNLVIPKENKALVLKDDIIDVMYPMLTQEKYMVVFKLLGTFRMIVDGQPDAALNLLSRKDFIERLVFWCYNSDNLGVRGEVPRIFSWLIKNCQSSVPYSIFISVKDSVKCLVDMITSNHGLMQNESFFALNLLAIGLANSEKHPPSELDTFYQSVCDASVAKNLNFVLNKYGDKWDKHTIENCMIFIENLIKSDKIAASLKEEGNNAIVQCIDKLKSNANAQECAERADKLVERLRQQ